MKKLYILFITIFITTLSFGQTSPGDIAFVAFNGDGNEDFAFVTLVDIPSGNSIWFTDNDWKGTGFEDLGEGELKWTADSDISAGSVIVINSSGANLGIVSGSSIDLNVTDESLFALLEEPSITMTTPTFLAGISNDFNQSNSVLTNTGLTSGVNFIDFDDDYDGYKYKGTISGEINFSDYLPLIMNKLNWQTEISDGTLILPISTTAFSIATASVTKNQIDGFAMYPNPVANGRFSISSNSNADKFVEIYSLLGKQVYSKNVKASQTIEVSNLSRGVYILRVEEEGKIATRKLVIQ